jgi:biopolymer transport protein TolQ
MEKAAELQQVDFSFMLLVMQAHWVVQAVFIVLMMSSLLAWAVVFEKFFLYQNVLSSVRKFEAHFCGGNTLEVNARLAYEFLV